MSLLDRITDCHQCDKSQYQPFYIGLTQVGWVQRDHSTRLLTQFPSVFIPAVRTGIRLQPCLSNFEQRTQALNQVIAVLREQQTVSSWRSEYYPIMTTYQEEPLCAVERSVTPFFGITTYGTHLNGYTVKSGELHLWIAERSSRDGFAAGKLDNIAAGGLPINVSPDSNVLEEALTEAGISKAWQKQLQTIGQVSYLLETPAGITPDVMFTYDMPLPEDFEPTPDGNEIKTFHCMPIQAVIELLSETQRVKYNSALVMIDFLIRHNIITADYPNYEQITTTLYQPLNAYDDNILRSHDHTSSPLQRYPTSSAG